MRTTTIFLLGALALACGGSGSASTDDTSSGTTVGNVDGSSTGGPACTPGTEGCACDEGACEGELSCFSNVCVVPPAQESSSSGGVDTSTSSGATTESSGTSDETAADSDSESSSSSTAAPVETCELEGNHLCQGGVLDTCVRGEVTSQSCDDVCAESGLLTTGCADINGCNCDGFADANCETITGKFCNCYALWGAPCNEQLELQIYGYCFDPTADMSSHDIVVCFGDLPTDTVEECDAASGACF